MVGFDLPVTVQAGRGARVAGAVDELAPLDVPPRAVSR
jgi:hypothetical protein